jgi:hypothetical protein
LFSNVEEPLYEDGQCLNNKGGMIRLFAFDAKAVNAIRLPTDPIAHTNPTHIPLL